MDGASRETHVDSPEKYIFVCKVVHVCVLR